MFQPYRWCIPGEAELMLTLHVYRAELDLDSDPAVPNGSMTIARMPRQWVPWQPGGRKAKCPLSAGFTVQSGLPSSARAIGVSGLSDQEMSFWMPAAPPGWRRSTLNEAVPPTYPCARMILIFVLPRVAKRAEGIDIEERASLSIAGSVGVSAAVAVGAAGTVGV